MRLIHAQSCKLVEYFRDEIPKYAILSHTWGIEEVTFQDLQQNSLSDFTAKKGWSKIRKACEIAIGSNLKYVWVDTCCIDKTNSVELSEAINSMYQWYKKSELCIAYLVDLDLTDIHATNINNSLGKPSLADTSERKEYSEEAFMSCRWWSRGWTLQELLASRNLCFYDSTWRLAGSKTNRIHSIAETTGIPLSALYEYSPKEWSVAQKFSWAAERQTTREEDQAYCLLGIFDVNMPLLYGEGRKAFRRLQEEIIKSSNDMTILAHDPVWPNGNLFAEHVTDFKDMGQVRSRGEWYTAASEFSLTNRGLHVKYGLWIAHAYEFPRDPSGKTLRPSYYARLGAIGTSPIGNSSIGICLEKVGPRAFRRDPRVTIKKGWEIRYSHNGPMLQDCGESHVHFRSLFEVRDCYILFDDSSPDLHQWIGPKIPLYPRLTKNGLDSKSILKIPSRYEPANKRENNVIEYLDIAPREAYYHVEQELRLSERETGHTYSKVIALRGSVTLCDGNDTQLSHKRPCRVKIIILVYHYGEILHVSVCKESDHRALEKFLFSPENNESSISWTLLRLLYPQVNDFGASIYVTHDDGPELKVHVEFEEELSYDSFVTENSYRIDVSVKDPNRQIA